MSIKFYGVVKKVITNGKGIFFAQLEDQNNKGLYSVSSGNTTNNFNNHSLEEGQRFAGILEQAGKVYTLKTITKEYGNVNHKPTNNTSNKDDISIHYDRISAISIADKKNGTIKDIGKFNEKVMEYTNEITNTRIELKAKHSGLPDYIFGYTFGRALDRVVNSKNCGAKTPIDKIMTLVEQDFNFMLPSFNNSVAEDNLEDKKPSADLKGKTTNSSSCDDKNLPLDDKQGWKDLEPEEQAKLDQALDIFESDMPN